jgi:hypothetical protein
VNNWKVILATMVIFATGVITGGLLVRNSNRMLVRQLHSQSAVPRVVTSGASNTRLEFLRRAERDLRLTPEQRERTEKILREGQERIKTLTEPVSGKIREELARTRLEFQQVLTPKQSAKFAEMLKQQQTREPRRSGNKDREGRSSTNAAAK